MEKNSSKAILKNTSDFFEIGYLIFFVAYAFTMSGFIIATINNFSASSQTLAWANIFGLSLMIGLFVFALVKKISRGLSLGITMIIAVGLSYISVLPDLNNPPVATNSFLFAVIIIAIFIWVGSMLVHRLVGLVLGLSTILFTAFAYFYIPTKFISDNSITLAVAIIGFSLLAYYYRKKLEQIASALIQQKTKAETALKNLQVAEKQMVVQE